MPEPMTEYQKKELCHKWAVTIATVLAALYAFNQFQDTLKLNRALAETALKQTENAQKQTELTQTQIELTRVQIKGVQDKLEAEAKAERELRAKELAEREKDYKVRFYEKRLVVYDEICEVTARIATHRKLEDTKPDLLRFEQLLLGKLTATADKPVMDAVWAFNDAIRELGPTRQYKLPTDLQPFAYDVATACKTSMARAFPTVPFAGAMVGQKIGGIGSLPPPNNPEPPK